MPWLIGQAMKLAKNAHGLSVHTTDSLGATLCHPGIVYLIMTVVLLFLRIFSVAVSYFTRTMRV